MRLHLNVCKKKKIISVANEWKNLSLGFLYHSGSIVMPNSDLGTLLFICSSATHIQARVLYFYTPDRDFRCFILEKNFLYHSCYLTQGLRLV